MSVALVYTLYGDQDAAEAAAVAMVEQGLAACANMLAPAQSVYRWEGALERQREYPVLFKTSEASRPALTAAIRAAHPYDVPAVLSWQANAMPDYAHWVSAMSGGT